MQTITIANEKGGVAKTTTAVHVAHGLSRQDAQVLLIDLDAQGNCALHLGMDPEPGIFNFYSQSQPLRNQIRQSQRPGLDFLPGNSYTKIAAREADRIGIPLDLLSLELRELPIIYDFVVIDTHPGGYFQEVALSMADTLIIPAALDYLSIDAVHSTIATAQDIAGRENKAPTPLLVLPQFMNRTNESQYNLGVLHEKWSGIIAKPIPQRVAVREAVAHGQTLYEYAPYNDAAIAYQRLITQLTLTDEDILFAEAHQ